MDYSTLKKNLALFLIELATIEKSQEYLRRYLYQQECYNSDKLFKQIIKNEHQDYISYDGLSAYLQERDLKTSEYDIQLLYKTLDRDEDAIFGFDDFCCLVQPKTNLDSIFNFAKNSVVLASHDYSSQEEKIEEIFLDILINEMIICLMFEQKKEEVFNNADKLQFCQIFRELDDDKKGYLDRKNLDNFLKQYFDNYEVSTSCLALNRLDYSRIGKIKMRDFMRFLSPIRVSSEKNKDEGFDTTKMYEERRESLGVGVPPSPPIDVESIGIGPCDVFKDLDQLGLPSMSQTEADSTKDKINAMKIASKKYQERDVLESVNTSEFPTNNISTMKGSMDTHPFRFSRKTTQTDKEDRSIPNTYRELQNLIRTNQQSLDDPIVIEETARKESDLSQPMMSVSDYKGDNYNTRAFLERQRNKRRLREEVGGSWNPLGTPQTGNIYKKLDFSKESTLCKDEFIRFTNSFQKSEEIEVQINKGQPGSDEYVIVAKPNSGHLEVVSQMEGENIFTITYDYPDADGLEEVRIETRLDSPGSPGISVNKVIRRSPGAVSQDGRTQRKMIKVSSNDKNLKIEQFLTPRKLSKISAATSLQRPREEILYDSRTSGNTYLSRRSGNLGRSSATGFDYSERGYYDYFEKKRKYSDLEEASDLYNSMTNTRDARPMIFKAKTDKKRVEKAFFQRAAYPNTDMKGWERSHRDHQTRERSLSPQMEPTYELRNPSYPQNQLGEYTRIRGSVQLPMSSRMVHRVSQVVPSNLEYLEPDQGLKGLNLNEVDVRRETAARGHDEDILIDFSNNKNNYRSLTPSPSKYKDYSTAKLTKVPTTYEARSPGRVGLHFEVEEKIEEIEKKRIALALRNDFSIENLFRVILEFDENSQSETNSAIHFEEETFQKQHPVIKPATLFRFFRYTSICNKFEKCIRVITRFAGKLRSEFDTLDLSYDEFYKMLEPKYKQFREEVINEDMLQEWRDRVQEFSDYSMQTRLAICDFFDTLISENNFKDIFDQSCDEFELKNHGLGPEAALSSDNEDHSDEEDRGLKVAGMDLSVQKEFPEIEALHQY